MALSRELNIRISWLIEDPTPKLSPVFSRIGALSGTLDSLSQKLDKLLTASGQIGTTMTAGLQAAQSKASELNQTLGQTPQILGRVGQAQTNLPSQARQAAAGAVQAGAGGVPPVAASMIEITAARGEKAIKRLAAGLKAIENIELQRGFGQTSDVLRKYSMAFDRFFIEGGKLEQLGPGLVGFFKDITRELSAAERVDPSRVGVGLTRMREALETLEQQRIRGLAPNIALQREAQIRTAGLRFTLDPSDIARFQQVQAQMRSLQFGKQIGGVEDLAARAQSLGEFTRLLSTVQRQQTEFLRAGGQITPEQDAFIKSLTARVEIMRRFEQEFARTKIRGAERLQQPSVQGVMQEYEKALRGAQFFKQTGDVEQSLRMQSQAATTARSKLFELGVSAKDASASLKQAKDAVGGLGIGLDILGQRIDPVRLLAWGVGWSVAANRQTLVKIDGRPQLVTFEELWNRYSENVVYGVDPVVGPYEIINLRDVETLSADLSGYERALIECENCPGIFLQKWGTERTNVAVKQVWYCPSCRKTTRDAPHPARIKPEWQWKPVQNIIRHYFKGSLLRINQKWGETVVTPSHSVIGIDGEPFLAKENKEILACRESFDLPQANELVLSLDGYKEEDGYLVPDRGGRWVGIKRHLADNDLKSFVRWIAAYLSEGSYSWHKNRGKGESGAVQISNNNREWLEHIADCYSKFSTGKSVLCNPDKNGTHRLCFQTTTAFDLVKQYGRYAAGKRFPDFLLSLAPCYQKAFLEEYIFGDGTGNLEGAFSITSQSQSLISGIGLLLNNLGIDFSVKVNTKYERQNNDTYQIRSVKGNRKANSVQKDVLEVPYDGWVYDLEVQGANNFIDALGGVLLHNTSIYRALNLVTVAFSALSVGSVQAFATAQTRTLQYASVLATLNPGLPFDRAISSGRALISVVDNMTTRYLGTREELERLTISAIQWGLTTSLSSKKAQDDLLVVGNAIKFLTIGMSQSVQSAQELRLLAEGQLRPQAQLLNFLRAVDPELQSHLRLWKAQGTTIENVAALLRGQQFALEAQRGTLEQQLRIVENLFKIIQRGFGAAAGVSLGTLLRPITSIPPQAMQPIGEGLGAGLFAALLLVLIKNLPRLVGMIARFAGFEAAGASIGTVTATGIIRGIGTRFAVGGLAAVFAPLVGFLANPYVWIPLGIAILAGIAAAFLRGRGQLVDQFRLARNLATERLRQFGETPQGLEIRFRIGLITDQTFITKLREQQQLIREQLSTVEGQDAERLAIEFYRIEQTLQEATVAAEEFGRKVRVVMQTGTDSAASLADKLKLVQQGLDVGPLELFGSKLKFGEQFTGSLDTPRRFRAEIVQTAEDLGRVLRQQESLEQITAEQAVKALQKVIDKAREEEVQAKKTLQTRLSSYTDIVEKEKQLKEIQERRSKEDPATKARADTLAALRKDLEEQQERALRTDDAARRDPAFTSREKQIAQLKEQEGILDAQIAARAKLEKDLSTDTEAGNNRILDSINKVTEAQQRRVDAEAELIRRQREIRQEELSRLQQRLELEGRLPTRPPEVRFDRRGLPELAPTFTRSAEALRANLVSILRDMEPQFDRLRRILQDPRTTGEDRARAEKQFAEIQQIYELRIAQTVNQSVTEQFNTYRNFYEKVLQADDELREAQIRRLRETSELTADTLQAQLQAEERRFQAIPDGPTQKDVEESFKRRADLQKKEFEDRKRAIQEEIALFKQGPQTIEVQGKIADKIRELIRLYFQYGRTVDEVSAQVRQALEGVVRRGFDRQLELINRTLDSLKRFKDLGIVDLPGLPTNAQIEAEERRLQIEKIRVQAKREARNLTQDEVEDEIRILDMEKSRLRRAIPFMADPRPAIQRIEDINAEIDGLRQGVQAIPEDTSAGTKKALDEIKPLIAELGKIGDSIKAGLTGFAKRAKDELKEFVEQLKGPFRDQVLAAMANVGEGAAKSFIAALLAALQKGLGVKNLLWLLTGGITLGNDSETIGTKQSGGPSGAGGLFVLHEGEFVLPKWAVGRMGGAEGMSKLIQLLGGNIPNSTATSMQDGGPVGRLQGRTDEVTSLLFKIFGPLIGPTTNLSALLQRFGATYNDRDPITWLSQGFGRLADFARGHRISSTSIEREEAMRRPGFEFGGIVPQAGLYRLHEKELVLPRSIADSLRAPSTTAMINPRTQSSGNTYIINGVNVTSMLDPEVKAAIAGVVRDVVPESILTPQAERYAQRRIETGYATPL